MPITNQMRLSLRLSAILGLLVMFWAPAAQPTHAAEALRFGLSQAAFGLANRNDAAAAFKVWGETLAREHQLQIEVNVEVMTQVADLNQALAQGTIDAAYVTTMEFIQLGEQPEYIYIVGKNSICTEQYVVVVRRDSNAHDVQDLRGRRLARHTGPVMGPALPWLETVLASQHLGPLQDFLGETTPLETPSKSVLRVFFRQSDACLLSTNAFAMACEMNPQLQQQLKVLLTSPPLVPSLMFFRKNYTLRQRRELEHALEILHKTTAGQQVLTVFQGSQVVKRHLAFLDSTRQVLNDSARLTGDANSLPTAAARLAN
jgi:ABC-type phosphate/phosphonate transport system substrate-binding protein